MKLKKYISGGLAATLMMLASSCRDETFSDYFDDGSEVNNISFTIDLEGMGDRTRATSGKYLSEKIGGGSKIDVLKYAVYYYNDEEKRWEADDSYGDTNSESVGRVEPGHGQTVLKVTKFPVIVNLALKKTEKYKIVFWAQNSETDAFVTEDLRKVQMKYKLMNVSSVETLSEEAKEESLSRNNDEARDAFCRSIDVPAGMSLKNQTVYLRRPLAQINIGTRGYDYETITRNATKKYYYSKVRINRAARYLDVVEDKILTSTIDDTSNPNTTEAFYTIDYDYALFPAYWNAPMPEDLQKNFHPSYTIHDFKKSENDVYTSESYVSNEVNMDVELPVYLAEEFLKVKVFNDKNAGDEDMDADGNNITYNERDDDGYMKYVGLGDGSETNENLVGEVFKYLSMCYVLTNCEPKTDESGEVVDFSSDVITNIKMWIATDENGADEVEVLNLNNVPVQRNKRTNIVGSLLTTKANVTVTLDSDFAGQKLDGADEGLSGEISEGLYYDAQKDELQISSLNGLLVFQQLVNGDLTVRSVSKNTNYSYLIGKNYPYYYKLGDYETVKDLEFKSIKKPADDLVRKRILAATHYHLHKEFDDGYDTEIVEDESDWPTLNNFSFAGANVKLMADIDLSGMDWIPIGFDMVNWDSTVGYRESTDDGWDGLGYRSLVYPIGKSKSGSNWASYEYKKGTSKVVVTQRRVFCGTFDGNGHTIYNLTSMRFSAKVHESQFQWKNSNGGNTNFSPYDNVQWFAQGLFGIVGPGATIKNIRLQNVNIFGRNGVGGVVGIVNSIGWPVLIDNCIVDGGRITAYPLYRGDNNANSSYGRTFARGVYVGGIAGQFTAYQKDNNTTNFGVNNCEVRNVIIHGFRRLGGILGAISDQEDNNMYVDNGVTLDIPFNNNRVSNSTILADQFMPFSSISNQVSQNETGGKRWQNGFGWASMLRSLGGIYVGGIPESQIYPNTPISNTKYNEINQGINVRYSEFKVVGRDINDNEDTGQNTGVMRKSTIDNVPLEMIPMLSSWFTDEVMLNENYYGTSGINTRIQFTDDENVWSENEDSKFKIPFVWPYEASVNYVSDSPKAAMYVESILLDGFNAPGGRSVITADNNNGIGDCVMYVTSRDRNQFTDRVWSARDQGGNKPADISTYSALKSGNYASYNTPEQPTIIKNIVLRGSPYAWTGILLAPNSNMSKVVMDNVNIYDVYQTISLDRKGLYSGDEGSTLLNSSGDNPFDGSQTEIEVSNSNFRGFTNPGSNWKKITYSNTTFEQGAETNFSNKNSGNEEYMTCKVGTTQEKTVFDGCYFKAPFIIDITPGAQFEFKNCYATSAYKNVRIDTDKGEYKSAKRIIIGTDVKKGVTTVDFKY